MMKHRGYDPQIDIVATDGGSPSTLPRDDSYANDSVAQTLDVSVLTSTPTSDKQTADQDHHAHARTRFLSNEDAIAIVRQVAGLLAEEQRCGSFDAAVVGPWLDGACCIAAAITALVLQHRGHAVTIEGGAMTPGQWTRITHWWAKTSDGWILDPTHGQSSWQISPVAARVSDTAAHNILPLEELSVEAFMQWSGHPSLPQSNRAVVDRVLTRMIGAPYAWE